MNSEVYLQQANSASQAIFSNVPRVTNQQIISPHDGIPPLSDRYLRTSSCGVCVPNDLLNRILLEQA